MERANPRLARRLIAGVIAAAIIAIVLGAAIFGAFYARENVISSGTTPTATNSLTSQAESTTVEQSSTPLSPNPCSQPYETPVTNSTMYPNGTLITKSAAPAFVMGTGSTMELCLKYTNNSNQNVSTSDSISAFEWPPCYLSCAGSLAGNEVISASPANIFLSEGQSIVVDYQISGSVNSTGFLGLSPSLFEAYQCRSIPLAVGYQLAEVNASDFPNYNEGLPNCPQAGFILQIVGYSGASIALLRNETSRNFTENVNNISISSFPSTEGGENVTFKMRVQTFSTPLSLGNSVAGYVRTFNGNPELTLTPGSPDNYCGWYVNNDTALDSSTYTSFGDMPSGYLQVDEPQVQMTPYSSVSYSFSVLIKGPIAEYTAIDIASDVAVTDFFPVSIGGQLQTNAGSCPSILQ